MTDVTDNFNRANGPLGANWLDSTGFTGGTMGIVSNTVQGTTSTWRIAYWDPAVNTFANDQHAEVTRVAGGSGSFIGAVVRHQPATSSGYLLITNGQIYRFSSGSFTAIGSGTVPGAVGTVYRLEINGSTLTSYANGVLSATVTDTTYSSGQPGIAVYDGALDDFLGGPIAGVSGYDTFRIKRRAAGGAAGPPTSLAAAEIAFNEQDNTLYYGKGNSGGVATSIIAIAGTGAFQPLDGDLTAIAGISGVQGDIIYRNASAWTRLGAGTSGQYLQTQGTSANPQWATVAAGGTPGGSNTQVQYNNSGAFGGATNMTWNNATSVLTVTGQVVISAGSPNSLVAAGLVKGSTVVATGFPSIFSSDASGGFIALRPNGPTDSTGQLSVNNAGAVTVNGNIELGNASDTTLARVSAGVVSIEGQNILTAATGQPLDGDLTAIAALTGTNNIYYRSAADTWSSVTIGSNLTFTGGTLSATGGSAPAAPTLQIFTSGSGTYTKASTARYITVEMVGGGGGGGGGTAATAGGNTTFGSSFLTCNGGGSGQQAFNAPATNGGTASGGDINITGQDGGTTTSIGVSAVSHTWGGDGGNSFFGSGGRAVYDAVVSATQNAKPNTGSGGSGGGTNAAAVTGGMQGGGAGGYLRKLIASPSSTYSYAVGAGGTGGSTSGNTYAGGNGAAGIIIVTEYY